MLTQTIYLIEDNIKYRSDLKKLIESYCLKNSKTNYNILPVSNYNHFFENIKSQVIRPSDIFIIDIDLQSYFTGIELGDVIRKLSSECSIIYLTSMMNKAIDTINKNIFPNAYLVKSNDIEITQLELSDILDSLMMNPTHGKRTFSVNTAGVEFLLTYSEVLYISIYKSFRNKLKIVTYDSQLIVNGPLSK